MTSDVKYEVTKEFITKEDRKLTSLVAFKYIRKLFTSNLLIENLCC